jgi:hypothetical protein
MTSSSKQTNSNSTSTTTPNAPSWATSALQGFTDKANAFGNLDPSTLVAPANGLQTQAATGASNLGGWADTLGQAKGLLGGDPYGNPYTDSVIKSSLNDFDTSAAQQSSALRAQQAGAGAFGGSGFGIATGQLAGQQGRARAALDSGLRSDAYDKQQANNLSQAGLLGQLASTGDTLQNNDITQQAAQGATMRGIDASQRTAGLSQLQALGSLLGMGQYGLLTGQTTNASGTSKTTDSPSLLSSIGQGATSISKLASLFG